MMNIKMEATIAAPREVVWGKFSDVAGWREWSPWRLAFEGRPVLGKSARFVVEARAPLISSCSVRFACCVTEYEEGRRVRWSGTPLGVPGYHEFEFQDAPAGCRVISREKFWCPQSVLLQAARGVFKARVREFLTSLDAASTGRAVEGRRRFEKGARGWVYHSRTGRASR